jgi:hypothetical protein
MLKRTEIFLSLSNVEKTRRGCLMDAYGLAVDMQEVKTKDSAIASTEK